MTDREVIAKTVAELELVPPNSDELDKSHFPKLMQKGEALQQHCESTSRLFSICDTA